MYVCINRYRHRRSRLHISSILGLLLIVFTGSQRQSEYSYGRRSIEGSSADRVKIKLVGVARLDASNVYRCS